MELYVKKLFYFHILSFFLVFKHDFIRFMMLTIMDRFANSDHYWLKLDVNLQHKECSTARTGFNYRAMNVQGIKKGVECS